jgi:hypothetical protein
MIKLILGKLAASKSRLIFIALCCAFGNNPSLHLNKLQFKSEEYLKIQERWLFVSVDKRHGCTG